MRIKDINKQEAIIEATVLLVNEIGFVSCSVSKIAKKANVSPATLYIYYKNKEDLLVSTYIEVKKKMSKALLNGFDDSMPFRDILEKFWKNGFRFVKNNKALFQYAEQFASSPFSELVNPAELEKHFEPMIKVLQKGIEQKVIKDVPFDILAAFIFYPMMNLANSKTCKSLELNDNTIEVAFKLAWDAIKL
ncbi:MAG: TetR/AcrR family transcriptional regulator [Bacteroidetes bacterium]|nr:TetR/AcrR family transcriptional regulator [Bacteroidota bacterium]MBU1116638.1 TetR/AcrR family transcriptional regulator [Bacteroidota bacterium]MBU1797511.1 TetR/AcrR family transcriptional regulator [Bacteroidota bacterium]